MVKIFFFASPIMMMMTECGDAVLVKMLIFLISASAPYSNYDLDDDDRQW